MLRNINHTTGVVHRESQFVRKKFGHELKDCTVLGVIPSTEKGQNGVEMLYLCTTNYSKKKSHSPFTFAASLLGNSKVLFFNHLMQLANMLSPDLAAPLYTGKGDSSGETFLAQANLVLDTDSIYLLCRRKKLEDCILPEKREEYERVKHTIFGSLEAEKSQAGLLISEGDHR